MKALVTGAGGFIGANLVRHLLAGGHEPIAVVRPNRDPWRLAELGNDAARVTLDLSNPEAIERVVLAQRPEIIFHLAAHGAYSWQQDLAKMLAVNVRAVDVLLGTARELGATVINAGSSSEYGYRDHPPREDELVRPNSHYAVTKVAATHLCQLAAQKDGVRALTLRLYSVYGPWEEPRRLIPTLVRHAAAGSWPPLVSPDTARDYVWIEDACEAFVRAATSAGAPAGAVFNVASGTQTTLRELVTTAREVFAVAAEPAWGTMAARAWDTSTWVGDPTTTAEDLSWRARTSLADGLTRMRAWLAEHPELEARYG